MSLSVIILAAGRGTRMGCSLPKVLHEVAGRSMLEHVVLAAQTLGSDDVRVVVGPELINHPDILELKDKYRCLIALQNDRQGTANAVEHGIAIKPLQDKTLVLYGDAPLVTGDMLQSMVEYMAQEQGAKILCLGFHATNPNGYGRMIVGDNNALLGVVEDKDASVEQKTIELCNSGIMLFDSAILAESLAAINNHNASGEYYLTDTVKVAAQQGLYCIYMLVEERKVIGVNTFAQLAIAEAAMQSRLRQQLMEQGVLMIAPETVFLAADVVMEPGVKLHPYVVIGKEVKVSAGTEIFSFSHIESTVIGANCNIGPYTRLRNDSTIGEDARIGNFVEVKHSAFGKSTKAAHLSYVGDAELGSDVNIGAGSIFCNYDGLKKHPTKIESGAFIGSNTCLIAPITVGKDALVAAGSVITKDVEANYMAVARSEQRNIASRGMRDRRRKIEGN